MTQKSTKKLDPRSHLLTVEIPGHKYQRWKVVDKDRRVILIDFRCIRSVPFKPVDYGARRLYRWQNPEQLKSLVDEYFESCYGPIRNYKTGGFYENPDGTLARGQIKPFTVSGLARYTHVSTVQLKKYTRESIDALGFPTASDYDGPSYSEIMLEAIKRIENYAEERLYDKDGFNGGRFVLDAAFNWLSHKEYAEIQKLKEELEIKQRELELKEQQLNAVANTVEPIKIMIKRAGEE